MKITRLGPGLKWSVVTIYEGVREQKISMPRPLLRHVMPLMTGIVALEMPVVKGRVVRDAPPQGGGGGGGGGGVLKNAYEL